MKRAFLFMLSVGMLLTVLLTSSNIEIAAAEKTAYGYQAVLSDPSKESLTDIASLSEAPTSGEYRVSTFLGIARLAAFINDGNSFENVTVYQTKNIDMRNNTAFAGIGTSATPFKGIFNGQSFEIQNLKMTSSTALQFGFFNTVGGNAVIKNVCLSGGSVSLSNNGGQGTGAIVGCALDYATVENCRNAATVSAKTADCVGGIVGMIDGTGVTVRNCTNQATVAGLHGVGGIIGQASRVAEISNCLNQGAISAANGSLIGGIAGSVKAITAGISDCHNQSTVTCSANPNDAGIGGIVGYLENAEVKNCTNTHKIAARGHHLGGIVGQTGGEYVNILSCTNTGEVAANESNVAGIVGYLNSDTATVKECKNSGEVSVCRNASGGIVGAAEKTVLVEACENTGVIRGSGVGGGIVGASTGVLTLRKCTNIAKIWCMGDSLCGSYVQENTTFEDSFGTENEVAYLGYQAKEMYTENGQTYQSIRLICTTLFDRYDHFGMNILVSDTKGNIIKKLDNYQTSVLCRELIADGKNVNVDAYCMGGYFYILDLGGIPVNSNETYTLTVEPFAVQQDGGVKIGKKDSHFLAMGEIALGKNFDYDVILGDPTVIFQGEEGDVQWGHFQFPHLDRTAGGYIRATWSYGNDDVYGGGGNASIKRQMISEDGGLTWRDVTSDPADQVVHDFPISGFQSVAGYDESQLSDTVKYPPAVSGGGYQLYFAEDLRGLSDSLNRPFTASLYNSDLKKYETKQVTVNWPHMPVYAWGTKHTVVPVNYLMAISSGYGFLEKDGVLYYCTYTRGFDSSATTREEAIANPYCYYYSVYVFKSTDGGNTWDYVSQVSVDEELYNSEDFNRNCEGFCEPMMSIMDDGSIVMLMRTGGGSPCYIVRSSDNCESWSKPVLFDSVGVLPQILTLDCGVTLSTYGRPGLYMRTTSDPTGQIWKEHIQIPLSPSVTMADLSCYYTHMIALDDHTALLIYSDFNHPDLDDGQGVRKSILVRKITIQKKG